MYVCICRAVTEKEVAEVVDAGARTVDDVGERCGAGTGCGSCKERICAILDEAAKSSGRILFRAAS
ncbi:(2Fe-2S)-binding protein [Skermania sp. ID1734]|uniref:(2Fe-2S)-binding protein n=1 Tax=Skermania sp. ID1734 TaxID=2597516 RepID=UPI00117F9345|nr:(2Fe-2S)-binding protein [Skermania sp. ID1734]TSE00685.1 (2Fe-2S)-binding protein [Skermania sp. ID1734]